MCQAITEARAMDIIEIDAASNTGVDNIRDLRERVNYAPGEASYKVYIIDEVHMLSNSASNALLKTLEEPPPHVIFVLATTEAHKVLPTIMSRCQRFDFRRISQADVAAKLADICRKEKIEIEPESLRLIARATTGSLRDAENLLQQLTTCYGDRVELPQVQSLLGISGDWRARALAKHIIKRDITAGVGVIHSVNTDGLDLRQYAREVVEYLRALLLVKTGAGESVDLPAEDIAELKTLAGETTLSHIVKAVKLFGRLELSLENYSTLPLELALVDCALPAEKEDEPAVRSRAEQPPARKPGPVSAAEPPPVPPSRPEAVRKEAPEPKPETPPEPVSTPAAGPAPAEASSAFSSPTGGDSEIERLRLNWKRCINDAPPALSRSRTAALLRSAQPVSIQGDVIILSFKFALHREGMEKTENRQIAEEIVSGFLGRPCRVRCVHEPEANHLIEEALKIGAQIIDGEER